jgi:HEPN domain-containing protein
MIKFFIKGFSIRNQNWRVIKAQIDFNSEQYNIAVQQAERKSQFTMDASQSGANRDKVIKYNMQLMGILAEIGCKVYLEKIINDNNLSDVWKVIRYDDVRVDGFQSPENEYDLKLNKIEESEEDLYVESRSSITHNRSFDVGLATFDIIGPYISIAKSSEEANDIYLRPLYQYIDYEKNDYSKDKFEILLKEGKIILYLVAGCTKEELDEKGIIKSMGQGVNQYKVLPIINSTDIIDFQNTICKLINIK